MWLLESHLVALLIFSCCTSLVMGTLSENAPRERAIAALKMFGAFVVSTLIGAWIMHFIR